MYSPTVGILLCFAALSSFIRVVIRPRDLLSMNKWILKNSVDGFAEYQKNKPQMQSLISNDNTRLEFYSIASCQNFPRK